MRNALKLAVTLAFACVLALGVAACGGGDESGSEATSSPSERGELSGTVTVWDTEYTVLPEYTKAIDQIDAQFEKLHPNVTVKREPQPLEGLEPLLRAAFTAKEGPDAILLQPGKSGVLTYTKGLEVLNDQISPELQDQLTQWESATPGFSPEGDRYGVPIGMVGFAFYYNKDLFEKAGLPREFEPQSWAEVREAGEKLKAAGIQPFVGGNGEGFENQWWLSLGLETEASAEQRAQFAAGEMPWTDEAITKAYGPDFEMQEAGLYAEDRFSKGFIEGCTDFAEGKGAMIIGFWNAVCFWGEFNPKLGEENVGFFFAPGSSAVSPYAAIVMSVPSFAKNKDAALALIEYEASKKGIETIVDTGGFMPNRADVSLPADAPAQARELVEASRQGATETSPAIMIPSGVGFGPMATEISAALQGRTSLEAAQQAMQETAEKTAR